MRLITTYQTAVQVLSAVLIGLLPCSLQGQGPVILEDDNYQCIIHLNPDSSVLGIIVHRKDEDFLSKEMKVDGLLLPPPSIEVQNPYFIQTENLEKEYYANGQLKISKTLENGFPDGPYIEYFENGKIMYQGEYQNGQRHGEWRSYYPHGPLIEIAYYKEGQLHGRFQEFDPEGNLYMECEYVNGKIEGMQYYYYEGQVVKKYQYVNGKGSLVRG